MAEPKVQLVAPIGNITVPGMNVTGVVTATTISGNIGVAASIIQGSDLDIGAGIITATSFVGDQIGTYRAASLTGSPDLVVGVVTSSGFVAQITGDVTGDLTGNVVGTAKSIISGNNLWVGVATATFLVGDGSNITGIAASTFTHQTVTANSATTSIDLSAGNIITFNQSSNTTVSFANTSEAMSITLIRDKDDTDTARTITWPDSVNWNGGSAPTLINNQRTTTIQQFQLLTRDSGVTWYGWETMKNDPSDTLWSIGGRNDIGQLGLNSQSPTGLSSPTQIGTSATWTHVCGTGGQSDGYGAQAALKSDGTIWMWGKNARGALGLSEYGGSGNDYSRSSPTQVGTDTDWAVIGRQGNGAFGVKTDGTMWIWGNNSYGALGLNNANARSSPTQLPGTTWSTDPKSSTAGAAIKTDGTLWVWGYGNNGRLGLNSSPGNKAYSSPTQVGTDTSWDTITGGGGTKFAVKTDGTFWAWGYASGDWDTGLSDKTNRSSPTQLPGSNWSPGYGKVTAFSQGGAAIKTDGTLWTWGNNGQGELGLNNKTEHSSPKQVGTDTTWRSVQGGTDGMMATKTDGTLWGWGSNTYGGLGQNSRTDESSPKQVGTATNWGEKIGYCANKTFFGMQLPT